MNKKRLIETFEFILQYIEKLAVTKSKPRDAPGKKTTAEKAVNRYQRRLATLYDEWSRMAADQLAEADDDERDALIISLVSLFKDQMKQLGNEFMMTGMNIGIGETPPTAELLQRTAEKIRENEGYIDNSLGPDLEARLRKATLDPDIMAVGSVAIFGAMLGMQARVESYDGAMWSMINIGVGERVRWQEDQRVLWLRDPHAQHCQTCLTYGDREYPSYDDMLMMTAGAEPNVNTDCVPRCRCWLLYWNEEVQDFVGP